MDFIFNSVGRPFFKKISREYLKGEGEYQQESKKPGMIFQNSFETVQNAVDVVYQRLVIDVQDAANVFVRQSFIKSQVNDLFLAGRQGIDHLRKLTYIK
jgi:hypothetical protein